MNEKNNNNNNRITNIESNAKKKQNETWATEQANESSGIIYTQLPIDAVNLLCGVCVCALIWLLLLFLPGISIIFIAANVNVLT